MPKRISADAILADRRPYVQFRGVDYPLRDCTVRERIERLTVLRDQQRRMEAETQAAREDAEASGEDLEDFDAEAWKKVQDVYARSLQEALEDVPDEVASSVTEREFEALQEAITAARELTFPKPEPEDVAEEDLKRTGAATAG